MVSTPMPKPGNAAAVYAATSQATGLLAPPAYGLPSKFSEWRNGQDHAVLNGLTSPARFVAQLEPTGIGKSLIVITQAILSGARCAVLTITKGLQDQYTRDFHSIGLRDVRGRNSYTHPDDATGTCDEGPCQGGMRCSYKERGACPYTNAYTAAKDAQLVITNYAYWLAIHQHGEGLGNFDLLVLDEAHDAPNALDSALGFTFSDSDMHKHFGYQFPPVPDDHWVNEQWAQWARAVSAHLHLQMAPLAGNPAKLTNTEYKLLKRLKTLFTQASALANPKCQWVVERTMYGIQCDPLSPAAYAEQLLFRGIKKVVLVSATLRPKTLDLLGIAPGEYSFQSYPSPFEPSRAPVYHVPTVRMDNKADWDDIRLWIARIDQIVSSRLDRKGIIHTVSFQRQQDILQHSRFAQFMFGNTRRERGTVQPTTQEIVEKFKAMPAPAILISPSLSTGYDFPGTECEWQIISKVPFPSSKTAVMQARHKADKDYMPYLTAQELVQSCGRGMRSEKDRCETFVIDDHVEWFLPKYQRTMVPEWFMPFVQWVEAIPEPAVKL